MTKKHPALAHGIADLPADTLTKRAAQIVKHLDAIDALMSDAVELTDAERKVALRLGGDEETTALEGVLAFAEARPELFTVLAGEDEGVDPATFETKLLRGRLANARTLGSVVARFDETLAALRDSALYVATLAKRPALAAYEIAKPYAARDREHGKKLNAAVDLFRAHAMASVRARKAKAAPDAAK